MQHINLIRILVLASVAMLGASRFCNAHARGTINMGKHAGRGRIAGLSAELSIVVPEPENGLMAIFAQHHHLVTRHALCELSGGSTQCDLRPHHVFVRIL